MRELREVRGTRHVWGDVAPPYAEVDPDDWAHGVWTALAVTLAEPLRRALWVDHQPTCQTCQAYGVANCAEGERLYRLLPDGDRVVIA